MVSSRRILHGLTPPVVAALWRQVKHRRIIRTPFKQLQYSSKNYAIKKSIALKELINQILVSQPLERLSLFNNPDYYYCDERIIEYPWCFQQLFNIANQKRLLDVGCTLNQEFTAPFLPSLFKELWFMNIGYEQLWTRGSMIINDIRKVFLPSEYFDVVTCLSVLEHIGMANYPYTSEQEHSKEDDEPDLWKRTEPALFHMRRMLKPDGMLLITVPCGKPENRRLFQVYGKEAIDRTVRYLGAKRCSVDYFRVTRDRGWAPCDPEECEALVYGEGVPAAQAIAGLRYVKES